MSVSTLETLWPCEHILGWDRASLKRVKPNQICITYDMHMIARNWFVMPELTESITAATKGGWAIVVPVSEQILHVDTWWLQLLWLVVLLRRPRATVPRYCPQIFAKVLVKLFELGGGGGVSGGAFKELFANPVGGERKMFEHIFYCNNSGHVPCPWRLQNGRVSGIVSVKWSCSCQHEFNK